MKSAPTFMVAIGIFYFLNLLLLWPGLFSEQMFPLMYPDIELYRDQPVFQLLQDAWFVVGIGLAAIGGVLLWGSRKPEEYAKGLILVVVVTELLFGFWDTYSAWMSYQVAWMAIATIVVHLLIIGWAVAILSAGSAQADTSAVPA